MDCNLPFDWQSYHYMIVCRCISTLDEAVLQRYWFLGDVVVMGAAAAVADEVLN